MNEYMMEAKRLADTNLTDNEGGPFGAVIVKDGVIVGKGDNRVLVNHDPTAHAEITAIRDASKTLGTHDLSGCVLYTSCYPCPMCLSAIIWANIKTVYYGNTKEDAANIGFRDDMIYDYIKDNNSNTDVLNLINIDRDETIKTFEEYNNKEDKELY
ncbi:MAG: nucleoside deaminase [Bacilli bacterium]|nr:nucleoside deaminase [Bacilli bacterium]